MQQLTGLDEMFLSLDTRRSTGHAAALAYFDGSSGEPRDELAFLRQRIAERLPNLPLFRWKLHDMPLGIDQRYWVTTPDLDLDYHVTGIKLRAPGGEKELERTVDRIMREHLDRDRPMWRMYVITGLADGRYCYLLKLTHGLADGSVIWAVYELLSDDPAEPLVTAEEELPTPPNRLGMLAKGTVGLARKPVEIVKLQAELAKWAKSKGGKQPSPVLSTAARLLPGELGKPVAKLANRLRGDDSTDVASLMPTLRPPKVVFNGTSTTDVTNVHVRLKIAELRKAGKLVGGTINDAVLAITAGALRKYLADHGGAPERPLITAAPISWRNGTETERWANQIWMLFMPIPTHLDDPLERLKYARAAANQAKLDWDGVPGHLLRRISALVPGALVTTSAQILSYLPGALNPQIYNLSISNVRGPAKSPTFGGREIENYVVYGFLPPGIGLLVAGQSLGDHISLCTTLCRDLMPGYEKLPGLLQESLDELLELAQD